MITWPTNTRDVINQIRSVIGRPGRFKVVGGVTECTLCSLEPVSQTSTDSLCSGCGGLYFLESYEYVIVSGHVTWKPADDLAWYPGGQMFEGDCHFQIEHTPANLQVVDSMVNVEIDGRVLQLDKVIPRGVPQLNRMILILQQERKDSEQ